MLDHRIIFRCLSIAIMGLGLLADAGAFACKRDSIFLDDSTTWTDENNQPLRLRDTLGKGFVILTMAYTNCQRTCAMTFQRLKRIEAGLKAANQPVTILIVSLDPEHDDAAKRKEMLKKQGIEGSHWRYLSGTQSQTDALAQELAVDPVALANHLYHKMKIAKFDGDGQFLEDLGPGDPETAKRAPQ